MFHVKHFGAAAENRRLHPDAQAAELAAMRRPPFRLAAILALAAAPALADPPPPNPALAFYPPAARAAGVSGSATLACERSARGALTNCQVASEIPAGQGFAAAALALAAQSVPNCSGPFAQPGHVGTYAFAFTAAPLAIRPDVLKPGWTIDAPHWMYQPSGEEFANTYPAAAKNAHLDGRIVMSCKFDAKGYLRDCAVVSETPPGYGFAAAALKLASYFQISPKTCGGRSVEGSRITIPIRYQFPR